MTADAINSLPAISGKLFDDLPASIRSYIYYLEMTIQDQKVQIQALQVQVTGLEVQVKDLEARLSKNSSNSSKPPSSDGLKRQPKSLRSKSDKLQGAQKGRIGKGLTPVEKKCSCCGIINRGSFPDNIKGPVQYGERIQALATYFAHRHFIPVDRVCEIFEDIFDIELSPGTCANIDERLFQKLGTFESSLKEHLLGTRVLHFDETGVKCEKKLQWVHVSLS